MGQIREHSLHELRNPDRIPWLSTKAPARRSNAKALQTADRPRPPRGPADYGSTGSASCLAARA